MLSNDMQQHKKTWKELVTAASVETDPEKLAMTMEEIFAALEERGRTPSPPQDPSGFHENPTEP